MFVGALWGGVIRLVFTLCAVLYVCCGCVVLCCAEFGPQTVMGMAYDQQPVYRHVMWKYRNANPTTKIGNPPATGFAGYNSGVMLLHLDRMRSPSYASKVLNSTYVDVLTTKYMFKGHLGDQDWLTLVSAEPENRKMFRTCCAQHSFLRGVSTRGSEHCLVADARVCVVQICCRARGTDSCVSTGRPVTQRCVFDFSSVCPRT